jgi:hypothetical protein
LRVSTAQYVDLSIVIAVQKLVVLDGSTSG